MTTTITTLALLQKRGRETGLPLAALLRIAAKSALIRYVATSSHREDFILKGGTLLHHVYHSPRFSIVDMDLTHREAQGATLSEGELNQALSVDTAEFAIDFSTVTWNKDNALWSADRVAYRLGGAQISQYLPRSEMSVTVSVREGEWLDPQDPVDYSDPLLTDPATFKVRGLTLEELAAEKILAWCSKHLVKHAIDLAYVARDHAPIDKDKVRSLVERKFRVEGSSGRYKAAGINRLDDLVVAMISQAATRILRQDWDKTDLLLPTSELKRADSLRDPASVERFLRDFWAPVIRVVRR